MKNIILLITSTLVITSCSLLKNTKTIENNSPTTTTPSNPISISIISNKSFFKNESSSTFLNEVITKSNCIIKTEKFRSLVTNNNNYTSTNDNGLKVFSNIVNAPIVSFKTYRSSKLNIAARNVTANANLGEPIINWNLRNNPRSISRMVNTAIHELTHTINYTHKNAKDHKSVPYQVGNYGEQTYDLGFCN